MAQNILSAGLIHTLVQNVVYALPSCLVHITSNAALEYSQDETNFTALTGANVLGVYCSAAFIRCPGGAAIVTLKA